MLRQSLAALSVASLPFVLHAGIFRGDEVLSLLNNVYSPLQAVYTALTGLGCLFYVLFSPCLHSILGNGPLLSALWPFVSYRHCKRAWMKIFVTIL